MRSRRSRGPLALATASNDVEGEVIGAVADGVESELKAGFVALDGHLFRSLAGSMVMMPLKSMASSEYGASHGGGARAESAVGDHFQSAGFEPRVGGAAFTAQILQIFERAVKCSHSVMRTVSFPSSFRGRGRRENLPNRNCPERK